MTVESNKDIVKNSVTARDIVNTASVYSYYSPWYRGQQSPLLPELPAHWSREADFVLRQTLLRESNWSSAVNIAISKFASQGWEVDDPTPLRKKRMRDLLLNANAGRGYIHYISQFLRGVYCTDNGGFTEIVRSSDAKGSRIIGIMNLDSRRCTRTNDPERPVIYRDLDNNEHELKYYQVFSLADMPDDGDSYFGVGLCAARRVYDTIRRIAIFQRFEIERAEGARPLSLHFISGITEQQIQTALESTENNRRARGYMAYGGAGIVALMQKEGISHVEVPFQTLPPGYDRQKELSLARLEYANTLGLDPQDLEPLGGQLAGTSTQTQVLDDKARGKTQAKIRAEFQHDINLYLMSESSNFFFQEIDYRDRLQKAQIATQWSAFTTALQTSGVLNVDKATQLLVMVDALPKALFPEDAALDTTLSDSDKLDPEQAAAAAQAQNAEALPPSQRPGGPAAGLTTAQKELFRSTFKTLAAQYGQTETFMAFIGKFADMTVNQKVSGEAAHDIFELLNEIARY